jgi:hypothetical protein
MGKICYHDERACKRVGDGAPPVKPRTSLCAAFAAQVQAATGEKSVKSFPQKT